MAESTGIVRRLDDLGRIVIPKELRHNMDIKYKDGLEIFTNEDSIILKQYRPACIFCGNAEDTVHFRGKKVCNSCKAELANYSNLDQDCEVAFITKPVTFELA